MENMMEAISGYLIDDALILIPALVIIEQMLKATPKCADWCIPWLLLGLGIGFCLCMIWWGSRRKRLYRAYSSLVRQSMVTISGNKPRNEKRRANQKQRHSCDSMVPLLFLVFGSIPYIYEGVIWWKNRWRLCGRSLRFIVCQRKLMLRYNLGALANESHVNVVEYRGKREWVHCNENDNPEKATFL